MNKNSNDEKWVTLDTFNHTWCTDNAGHNMVIFLQERSGNFRMKMTSEGTIIGCHLLPLTVCQSQNFDKIRYGQYNLIKNLMEGKFKEGSDLRDIARFLGHQFVDPAPDGLLEEV